MENKTAIYRKIRWHGEEKPQRNPEKLLGAIEQRRIPNGGGQMVHANNRVEDHSCLDQPKS